MMRVISFMSSFKVFYLMALLLSLASLTTSSGGTNSCGNSLKTSIAPYSPTRPAGRISNQPYSFFKQSPILALVTFPDPVKA